MAKRGLVRRGRLSNWSGGTLRARIRAWTIIVITLTLGVFTGTGILMEREEIILTEGSHARALLGHLVTMPEFQSDLATANARLALMCGSLDAAGGRLEIVPQSAELTEEPPRLASQGQIIVATRELQLRDGRFELRYRADTEHLWQATRRSALLHTIHGLIALGALLLGVGWIFRNNLEAPLSRMSHEVKLIGGGGGWRPMIPPADSELDDLATALKDLGPSLEEQVREWVAAERRSGVAMTLNHIIDGVRYPLLDARLQVRELQTRGPSAPEREGKLRLLLADVDAIAGVLQAEEQLQFGVDAPAGGRTLRAARCESNTTEPDRRPLE